MAAILSVYREGVLHCQVEVGPQGIRIGRGPENDVMLEDPQKRVSRFHAELRWESERLILADLHSANGTLVDGVRVETIELPAKVPVLIGPYRMMWEEWVPSWGIGELQTASSPAALPTLPAGSPPPAAVESAAETTARTADAAAGTWRRFRTPLLLGGAVVALALLVALGWWWMRPPEPEKVEGPPAPTYQELVAAARQQVSQNTVAGAKSALESIQQALALQSTGKEALDLKDAADKIIKDDEMYRTAVAAADACLKNGDARCALEQAAAALAIRPDDVEAKRIQGEAEKLDATAAADAAFAEGNALLAKADEPSLREAVARFDKVLSIQPENADAAKLKRRAQLRLKALIEAGQKPPEDPGLVARYDDAVRKVKAGTATAAQQAIRELEQLRRDSPTFRQAQVAALITEARGVVRAAAQEAFRKGEELESAGDLVGTVDEYERARRIQADAVPDVEQRLADARRKKLEIGEKALRDGRNYYNARRYQDAKRELDKARRYLEPGSDKYDETVRLLERLGAAPQ